METMYSLYVLYYYKLKICVMKYITTFKGYNKHQKKIKRKFQTFNDQ